MTPPIVPITMLDNEFDLEIYADLDDDLEVIDCLQAKSDLEKCEQTIINPMWAWLDYEFDPEGVEGCYPPFEGHVPEGVPIPFKVGLPDLRAKHGAALWGTRREM